MPCLHLFFSTAPPSWPQHHRFASGAQSPSGSQRQSSATSAALPQPLHLRRSTTAAAPPSLHLSSPRTCFYSSNSITPPIPPRLRHFACVAPLLTSRLHRLHCLTVKVGATSVGTLFATSHAVLGLAYASSASLMLARRRPRDPRPAKDNNACGGGHTRPIGDLAILALLGQHHPRRHSGPNPRFFLQGRCNTSAFRGPQTLSPLLWCAVARAGPVVVCGHYPQRCGA